MRNVRGDHSEILAWLGRDLLGVAIEAWQGRLSDEEIGSSVETLTGLQGLPPAVQEGAVHSVRQAVGDLEAERNRIAHSRVKSVDPLGKPVSDRLCLALRSLLKAALPFNSGEWRFSDVKFALVSDDVDVGATVNNAIHRNCPGTCREVKVRAGCLKRVWEAGLGWTADKCLNLDLRPLDARVPFFDAYAAIWVECSDARLRRHAGVMLVHQATGAARHGADVRAAIERPIEFYEAEKFIRQSLQPLEEARARIRASDCGSDREIELPIGLAEQIRAHQIWIGDQLGGPLGEIFRSTAKKGYMFRPMERGIDLFAIRSGDGGYFRLCRHLSLTLEAEHIDRLPAVPMATTAHEQIFGAAFRRKYGDEGLKFEQ